MLSSVILIDLLTRLLGLVRSLVNPKLLGAEAYGHLGVLSAILLFAAFCDLGMNREFELAFPHARDPSKAVKLAIRNYLIRAIIPIVVLTGIIIKMFGPLIGAACVPYLVGFGMTEIFLIALRAEKKYAIINAYALLSGLTLTGAVIIVAPRFGVSGIAALQSVITGAGAIGLVIVLTPLAEQIAAIRKENEDKTDPRAVFHALPSSPTQAGSALWLLFGQLLPLTWLTIDRFLLSGKISAHEMGYWTLGGLPGGILAGVTNTASSLHMSAWIKRQRPFFERTETICFFTVVGVGFLTYAPFVTHFLHEYAPGIAWNHRLILAHVGVALLFFYDGYRRSLIHDAVSARHWFVIKLVFTVLGFGFGILGTQLIFHGDPRLGVICSFHLMLLLIWAWEQQLILFLLQLVLAALSLNL